MGRLYRYFQWCPHNSRQQSHLLLTLKCRVFMHDCPPNTNVEYEFSQFFSYFLRSTQAQVIVAIVCCVYKHIARHCFLFCMYFFFVCLFVHYVNCYVLVNKDVYKNVSKGAGPTREIDLLVSLQSDMVARLDVLYTY